MKVNSYPVLKEGDFPARCNFRCIVQKDDIYHIFEEDYTDHWHIYKRTSNDGLRLGQRSNPLLKLGESGEFDEFGQADPTVIYDGQWQMWFDAMNRYLYWDQIGYATSEDGENWIKKGTVLSRGKKGEWDDHSVHHPIILKYDKYYLYYSGCKKIEGNLVNYNVKNIGLAISDNGINFEKKGVVIPVGDDWDSEYVRPSVPVFFNGLWCMFYWGFNGYIHSMGIAISDDLINWDKRGWLIRGNDSHDGVTASHAIAFDDFIRIWYTTFDDLQLHVMDIYE